MSERRSRSREQLTRPIAVALAVVLASGFGLQIARYAHNRSLWLDEAFLARNIVERSLPGLVATRLDHDQSAPVGYLYAVKLATLVLGDGEYGLRLVSLLSAMALLVLIWALARRWLPPAPALVAVAMLALADPLIYFAAEVKQYATEACVVVALLLVCERRPDEHGADGLRRLTIAGLVGIAFSHSAIFVLAGLGVTALIEAWRRGDRSRARRLVGVGAVWLSGFALSWAALILPMTHADVIDFWSTGFAPIAPSLTTLDWYVARFAHVTDAALAVGASGLVFVLAVLGVAHLKAGGRGALLAAPLGFVWLAAVLHAYPLLGRMVVFLAPLLALLSAAGVAALMASKRRALSIGAWAAVAVLLAGPFSRATTHLIEPPDREETRRMLKRVAASVQPADVLYIKRTTGHALVYYVDDLGSIDLKGARRVYGDNHLAFEGFFAEFRRWTFDRAVSAPGARVWLVFSTQIPFDLPADDPLAARATRLQTIVEPGVVALLYRFR